MADYEENPDKSGVGRPTVITPEIISKLEFAFSCDMNDLEACFFAGIGKTTYYERRKADQEFADRMDGFKNALKMKAKMVVRNKIVDKEDIAASQWHLERRAKDEYSPRNEMTGRDGRDLPNQVLVIEPIEVKAMTPSEENTQKE